VKRQKWLRTALGLVFSNFLWKVFSLAAAVLLWVLVASEPELSTFVTVPVEYQNKPSGLEISSEIIESVYLELRGPSGELRRVSESKRSAVVLDMSHARIGEYTFNIGPGQVKLPSDIDLVRAIPSQIRFVFEDRRSRVVPVQPNISHAPAAPYQVTESEVSPAALEVEGPESRVNRVRFVATDPIDLTRAVGPTTFHVNAFIDDPHVRFVSRPQVTVDVKVGLPEKKHG
jgi:YbbR domain-containing protein